MLSTRQLALASERLGTGLRSFARDREGFARGASLFAHGKNAFARTREGFARLPTAPGRRAKADFLEEFRSRAAREAIVPRAKPSGPLTKRSVRVRSLRKRRQSRRPRARRPGARARSRRGACVSFACGSWPAHLLPLYEKKGPARLPRALSIQGWRSVRCPRRRPDPPRLRRPRLRRARRPVLRPASSSFSSRPFRKQRCDVEPSRGECCDRVA